MFIKSVIALVATSALAMKLVQRLSQQQQVGRGHDGKRHSDEVNRWEAEGGTPSTAKKPAKRAPKRAAKPAED